MKLGKPHYIYCWKLRAWRLKDSNVFWAYHRFIGMQPWPLDELEHLRKQTR